MPKGEFKPLSSTERMSATPSPSVSRSRVMRLALGTAAPARFITHPLTQALMPVGGAALGGALGSAPHTPPLGSTSSQRGWSRSRAKACTRRPGAGVGMAPAGQPRAGAMFTVGISARLGAGKAGLLPEPSATVKRAGSAQAPSASSTAVPAAAQAKRHAEERPLPRRVAVGPAASVFTGVVWGTTGDDGRDMGEPSGWLVAGRRRKNGNGPPFWKHNVALSNRSLYQT